MKYPTYQNFEDYIYNDLLDNQYLIEIFQCALYNYSIKVLGIKKKLVKFNVVDGLKFANILTDAKNVENKDTFILIGQELIILLKYLYPDDKYVNYYLGVILSNVSNFRGIKTKSVGEFVSIPILDSVFYEYEKSKLSIPTLQDEYFFYEQKKVYDGLKNKYFSYSGPTSMGKSFLIQIYIKEQVEMGASKNFAIIVPTKALINEVRHNILEELKESLIPKDYRVVSGVGDIVLRNKHNYIFVLTQERLLHLLIARNDIKVDFLFIDEAQKLSDTSERSIYYHKIIDRVIRKNANAQIIFASPNIPNPEAYLESITNIKKEDIHKLASKYSPVCQIKFLIDLLDDKTYVYNDLLQKLEIIENSPDISDLNDLIKKVSIDDKQTVVYCNGIDRTIDLAIEYSKCIKNVDNEKLDKLADDVKKYVHKDCYLINLIHKGIAYHFGNLPLHIKKRIEDCFISGDLKVIFCTSTLMEGVNLPADNLIVLNYGIHTVNMTEMDFKNLIGRVGRIKYNLYGNVYLLRLSKRTAIQEYEKLLSQPVSRQKLSIKSDDFIQYYDKIVNDLLNGDLTLSETRKNLNKNDEFTPLRRIAVALIRDIIVNRNTSIRKSFNSFLDEDKIKIIKQKFPIEKTSDDISISNDQVEKLSTAIQNGLSFPDIKVDGKISDDAYTLIKDFLNKLKDIFKWEIYESGTVGVIGNSINWYSLILLWWMQGYGVNRIISKSLKYHSKDSNYTIMNRKHKVVLFDSNNYEHINLEIEKILDVIEHVILFTISNYFRKFSLEYKKIHNCDNFDNDWYEYVEYGTMNSLTIFLQQSGFSRDASTFLELPENRSKYIKEDDDEIKIYNTIFECDDWLTCIEAKEIQLNIPELFVDEIKQ